MKPHIFFIQWDESICNGHVDMMVGGS